MWSGERKEKLEEYAIAKNVEVTDEDTQIEFLISEIIGGEADGYANNELKVTKYNEKNYTPDNWKKTSSLKDAVEIFYYIYVKPENELTQTEVEDLANKAKPIYEQNKGKTVQDIAGKNVNETQLEIVKVAKDCTKYGVMPEGGYCMGWVTAVYKAAGAPASGACCARCGGNWYSVSKDLNNIPIGACVYSYSGTNAGSVYGHVSIYLGNGMVAGCERRWCSRNNN